MSLEPSRPSRRRAWQSAVFLPGRRADLSGLAKRRASPHPRAPFRAGTRLRHRAAGHAGRRSRRSVRVMSGGMAGDAAAGCCRGAMRVARPDTIDRPNRWYAVLPGLCAPGRLLPVRSPCRGSSRRVSLCGLRSGGGAHFGFCSSCRQAFRPTDSTQAVAIRRHGSGIGCARADLVKRFLRAARQ